MRKLQKPTDDARQVYRTCISLVRSRALKRRLESVEANVVAAAEAFEAAATDATLHTIPTQDNVGSVSKDEMSDVYTIRMAKKGMPGRTVYDKLLIAPAYGRCPLCGLRMVSTLDHHLPKAHYPALAVVPINLVPACADCNKAKTDETPQNAEEQTLHPYYDDVEDDQWLFAEVFETSPAAIRYFVDPPEAWDEVKAERVRYHFGVFKLAALYASHVAEELVGIRYRLARLFAQAGADAVKIHLQEEAETRESAHTNSWQTAMYQALAASDWFCEGGFQQ